MPKNLETIPKKPKSPFGRPTDYTKEKADFICNLIATHDCGIGRLCEMYSEMPDETTVHRWRLRHEDFCKQYARAKMKQADLLAEKCLDISDNSTAQSYMTDRLRIDTRKWLASKLLPKQYGEKILLEQKTEENDKLKEELLALRKELDERNKKEY